MTVEFWQAGRRRLYRRSPAAAPDVPARRCAASGSGFGLFSGRWTCLLGLCLALAALAVPAAAGGVYKLSAQDKIRLSVYEWRAATDEIFEWKALNQVFTVTAAGALSLPIVGEVPASGLTTSELASAIGARIAERLHLGAPMQVGVEVVEYRPFYAIGAVEKPGGYPYQPGLTVLKAVALAGGLSRAGSREAITSQSDMQQASLQIGALLLRRARFKAELAGAGGIELPPEILERKAEPLAALLIAQEETIFRARMNALATQTETLNRLKEYLEKEIVSLEEQVALKKEEVRMAGLLEKSSESLATKGYMTQTAQFDRARLRAQLTGDRLRLESALLKVRQDISRTEVAIIEARNAHMTEAATQLQVTEVELEQARTKLETSAALLYDSQLPPPVPRGTNGARREPFYTILRERDGRAFEIEAAETAEVEAGDTVKVEFRATNTPPGAAAGGPQTTQ